MVTIIVLIFDSGIFAFLDVSDGISTSRILFRACAGISDEHARYFEGTLMIGLYSPSVLKNLTQG